MDCMKCQEWAHCPIKKSHPQTGDLSPSDMEFLTFKVLQAQNSKRSL